jgi:D-alanyl-D-alanine carboxypeptidase
VGKERIDRFVKEMNRVALVLNLKHTEFSNPHGLSSKANHSTAFELGKLAAYAMKYSRHFFTIVNTKVHNAVTYLPISKAARVLKTTEEELQTHV